MTEYETQSYVEEQLRKNLRQWFTQSTTLLNQLAGLPLTNASANAMSDLISGFHDLEPSFRSLEENAQEELDATAEAYRQRRD